MNTNLIFVRELGSGGQGNVCLYRDSVTHQEFAVKLGLDAQQDSSLLTECLLLRNNIEGVYKNIVKYNSHATHNGRRFMAMEHLPQSIEEFLA
jgi:serine/threonine protein kinase